MYKIIILELPRVPRVPQPGTVRVGEQEVARNLPLGTDLVSGTNLVSGTHLVTPIERRRLPAPSPILLSFSPIPDDDENCRALLLLSSPFAFDDGPMSEVSTEVKTFAPSTIRGIAKSDRKRKEKAAGEQADLTASSFSLSASLPEVADVRPRRRSAASANERMKSQLEGERQAEEDGLASPL